MEKFHPKRKKKALCQVEKSMSTYVIWPFFFFSKCSSKGKESLDNWVNYCRPNQALLRMSFKFIRLFNMELLEHVAYYLPFTQLYLHDETYINKMELFPSKFLSLFY